GIIKVWSNQNGVEVVNIKVWSSQSGARVSSTKNYVSSTFTLYVFPLHSQLLTKVLPCL
ncbi:4950_t:CDS:2, partial [Dentiscutata heterogama]